MTAAARTTACSCNSSRTSLACRSCALPSKRRRPWVPVTLLVSASDSGTALETSRGCGRPMRLSVRPCTRTKARVTITSGSALLTGPGTGRPERQAVTRPPCAECISPPTCAPPPSHPTLRSFPTSLRISCRTHKARPLRVSPAPWPLTWESDSDSSS